MTTSLPDLRSNRLLLRRPIPDDVETRYSLGTHREIVEGYGGVFDPDQVYSRTQAEAAIRFIEEQPFAWVIAAGRFIGHIRLHDHASRNKRAALAVGIEDPAYLDRGYGTEAIKLVLAYAFGQGLHRVSLRVLASNARAIACYQKCGFKEEGREREAAFISGGWQDDVIMGVLEHEFAALNQ